MPQAPQSLHDDPVTRALNWPPWSAHAAGPGEWRLAAPRAGLPEIHARRCDHWLDWDAWPPEPAATETSPPTADLWATLLTCQRLPPQVKLVLRPSDRRPVVQAEIDLDADSDPTAAIHATLSDTAAACCPGPVAPDGAGASAAASACGAPVPGEPPADDLAAACAACGWPFNVRDNGVIAVALEVPGRGYHALLERNVNQLPVARVDLAGLGPLAPVCRRAIAFLLFRAAAEFRLVRAWGTRAKNTTKVGLEVALPEPVAPPFLGQAFEALSVACRFIGREVTALTDAGLARAYLLSQGWGR
jgi:hypothetical protein